MRSWHVSITGFQNGPRRTAGPISMSYFPVRVMAGKMARLAIKAPVEEPGQKAGNGIAGGLDWLPPRAAALVAISHSIVTG